MNRTCNLFALALGLILGGSASVAQAQNVAFPYQGRLEHDGTPVDGTADLTFTVYDGPEEGAAVLWFYEDVAVDVENGHFSLDLPLDDVYALIGPLFLGVAVTDADSGQTYPLVNRQRIAPAVQAVRAAPRGYDLLLVSDGDTRGLALSDDYTGRAGPKVSEIGNDYDGGSDGLVLGGNTGSGARQVFLLGDLQVQGLTAVQAETRVAGHGQVASLDTDTLYLRGDEAQILLPDPDDGSMRRPIEFVDVTIPAGTTGQSVSIPGYRYDRWVPVVAGFWSTAGDIYEYDTPYVFKCHPLAPSQSSQNWYLQCDLTSHNTHEGYTVRMMMINRQMANTNM